MMDTLLGVIAVLGTGALVISAWVFASAARRYVSGEDEREEYAALDSDLSPYRREWVSRSGGDRRRNPGPTVFPITVNGERIDRERRVNPDRRRSAAG